MGANFYGVQIFVDFMRSSYPEKLLITEVHMA